MELRLIDHRAEEDFYLPGKMKPAVDVFRCGLNDSHRAILPNSPGRTRGRHIRAPTSGELGYPNSYPVSDLGSV